MRKLTVLLCLLFSSYLLHAQQAYMVKVTDSKTGAPVTDASATIRGTSKGASAGSDGTINIQAKINDVLDITSIGYKPITVKLTGTTSISVKLEASSVDLGDIVVIGSRSAGRAKTETAVPVDVIRVARLVYQLPRWTLHPF